MSDSGGPSSRSALVAEKRCLSALLEWGFALDVFAPSDVFSLVPPRELMRALAHRPEIKKRILDAAGLSPRPGESAAALGDRVLCAIECGDTDGRAVLSALPLDDCAWLIPHLAALPSVWKLLSMARPTASNEGRAFVGCLLERAKHIGLLSDEDLFDVFLSLDEHEPSLLPMLTADELVGVARCLLRRPPASREAPPADLFDHVLPSRLAEIAPIETLWDDLLQPRFVAATRHAEPAPTLTFEFAELSFDEEESVTVSRRSSRPDLAPDSAPSGDFSEREGVVAALASVGRLPPHHSMLPLAILRGMEQLYWALLAAETIEQRVDAFYTTFPNEADLRVALVAMQPIFFPDDEVQALAETEGLIAAIEEADREINAREISSGISPRMPDTAEMSSPTSTPIARVSTPLARMPLRSVLQRPIFESSITHSSPATKVRTN
jgi:hypothetical protein